MCQCSNTSRQITPTVLYNYVADYITQRGGLYPLFVRLLSLHPNVSLTNHIYTLEKQYGVVVVGYALQGQLQLFTDCPSGRHPSELNYCSMCVPGQSGTFCSVSHPLISPSLPFSLPFSYRSLSKHELLLY